MPFQKRTSDELTSAIAAKDAADSNAKIKESDEVYDALELCTIIRRAIKGELKAGMQSHEVSDLQYLLGLKLDVLEHRIKEEREK